MATELSEPTQGRFDVDVHDVEYQRQGDRVFLARVYQPRGPGPFPTVLEEAMAAGSPELIVARGEAQAKPPSSRALDVMARFILRH